MSSLAQYVEEAQAQDYENTRAQFEAFIDHANNTPLPSTGTIYWQMNKGWPTLLWSLYNNDYDQAGEYFGAQKVNQPLHALFTLDNHTTASIGNNAHVTGGGDVLVYATDDSQMTVISGALAGGFVGVGASVGVTVIHKDTRAFIGDGAHVDAKAAGTGLAGVLNGVNNGTSFGATSAHGVVVQAQSTEKMLNLVVAGGAGFVGVSGAVGVTLIGSNTTAFIGHNAQINQVGNASAAATQSVYVNASNDVHVTSFVGAIAGGFVGVGGAVAVGSLKNNTKAEIQSGAHVAANVSIAAQSEAGRGHPLKPEPEIRRI